MDLDEMAELELAAGFDQAYEDPYCDYCEREGHTFRTCPERDDD